MKEIIKKDGNLYESNIITGDDISMSSPFTDKTLTEVLLEHEEQMGQLTRNVKYLTKYGGVGGGGGAGSGGGSGTVKTKFSSTITYTNLDGTTLTDNIRPGSFYAVQRHKEVTITVILTSTATLNLYNLSVTVGSSTINKTFSGAGKTATVSFTPETNSVCIIQVAGETTNTISCSLFVNTNNFFGAIYDGEIVYSSDQEVYRSVISKPTSLFRIKLDNFLPDTVIDESIIGISVNGVMYRVNNNRLEIGSGTYEVRTETNQETNTRSNILEITDCFDIFGNYGIYKIVSYYHYNNSDLSQEVNYIYKSEDSFVYCFSNTGTPTLYQESQRVGSGISSSVTSSNNYTENFQYRVYGRSGLDSSRTYSLYYTIFKEGDEKVSNEPWTYIDETTDQVITLPVGTTYFATFRDSRDGSYGTGATGSSSNQTFYRVIVSKNGSRYTRRVESFFKPTVSANVGTVYGISFSNSYLPDEFDYIKLESSVFSPGVMYYTKVGDNYVETSEVTPQQDVDYYYAKPKEIIIKFFVSDPDDSNHDTVTTYYTYVSRTRDLEYVFTNQNGSMFYGAVHSNTTDVISDVIDFPWQDGKYKLTEATTKYMKSLCTKTINLPNNSNLRAPTVFEEVSGSTDLFPFQQLRESGNVDGLFNFGLKYYNDDYDSPVLKLSFNQSSDITFYKTKIVYRYNTATTNYTRFVFPSDNKYHLISFYFKASYSYNGKSGSPALLILIDGVIELAPITLDRSCSITNNTSITWYPGLWDYNYMGVMTFNGEPTNLDSSAADNMPGVGLIRKYYHDFDVIIPSNYYQTYREFCGSQDETDVSGIEAFDSSIYDSLGDSNNWINYYGYSGQHLNKFVLLKNWQIGNLTDLPIYVVQLEALESDTTLNGFIRDTLRSYKEEEADIVPKYVCSFQKLSKTGDTWTPTDIYNDVRFTIKYQGSSTLLYGAKNFYIESIPVTENDYTYDFYWTPDKNKFKPEKGFNLKADMVDSSHSNNVIIGNFVNDYFNDEDNPGFGRKEDGIRPCLTGEPIILIMTDSTMNSSEPRYLYLGIYNLNLTRSSVINLGYQSLNTDHPNCTKIESNFPDEADLYKVGGSVISYPSDYVVAEVQGNNRTLYDYSQYDRGLLKYMFGDFYSYGNGSASETYNPAIEKAFRGLNKLVYDDILKHDTFNVLNIPQEDFDTVVGNFYYYPTGSDTLRALDSDQKQLCLSETKVEGFLTYSDYRVSPDQRRLSVVGNPLYQFHQIVDSSGNRVKFNNDYYYYLETLAPLETWTNERDDMFHYVNVLKYYMVCMAFAMVDSVQKNLTIKCRNFNANGANTWYLGFYDMDTAFGVNNSGGQVDFKAFSDYITSDGEIVQDYCPIDITLEENNEGSLFDTPSSFLFLFAKYGNIFHTDQNNPIIGSQYSANTTNPLRYWVNLREIGGAFESADKFCENYANHYFGSMNPLLWNLNYMYKYFSETNNSNSSDTEVSKFNGTMKHRRSFWLNNRFRILDVLFGIKNDSQIGNSSYHLNGSNSEVPVTVNNPDVEITQTMFEGFKKGYPSSSFSFEVHGEPRTPIVFQTSSSKHRLFIIGTTGTIGVQTATITSDVDCGFYGTQKISSLNEFGQFLLNREQNTIINSKIREIKILRGTATGSNPLLINLPSVKSVSSITIDVSSSKNTEKFSDITIQVPEDSDSSYVLENLIIKGITANTLRIVNLSSTQSLTIKNFSLTNSTINSFYLDTVIIGTACTFGSTNRIGTYHLKGALKNISITDDTCTQFSLETSSDMTLTTYLSSVETMSLSGTIKKVTFCNSRGGTDTFTCTSLTTRNLGCQNGFTMRGTSLTSLELKLDSSVTSLNEFNLYNNNSLSSLKISGTELTDIYYSSSAFYSTPISSYQINCALSGDTYKDLTKVPIKIHYDGSGIFSSSHIKKEYIMPSTTSGVLTKYHLSSTMGLSSFISGSSINGLKLADIAALFNDIEIDLNSANVDLSNMCANLTFSDGATLRNTGNTANVTGVLKDNIIYSLPTSYEGLVDGFRSFLDKLKFKDCRVTSIEGWMYETNVAIVTKEFFKLSDDYPETFQIGGDYSTGFTEYSNFFGSFGDSSSPGYSGSRRVFVEKGLLGKFVNINIGWPSHVIFFDRWDSSLGRQSDTGSDIIINTSPGFDDIFVDSNTDAEIQEPVTTTITRLTIYTDQAMVFDCQSGWPSSIRVISEFGSWSSSCFMRNFHNMFDNVNKSCSVYLDRFMNWSTETWINGVTWKESYQTNYDGRIMLRDFFLDSDGHFKFTPRLSSKISPENIGLSKLPDGESHRYESNLGFFYPKYLRNETEFKELLKVFKYGDGVITPTDIQQDWSYLFSNCYLVRNRQDATWESMIRDDEVSDLFQSETVTYFDRCIGLRQASDLDEGSYYIKDHETGKAFRVTVKRLKIGSNPTIYHWYPGDLEPGESPSDEYILNQGDTWEKVYAGTYLNSLDGTFRGFKIFRDNSYNTEMAINPTAMFNDPVYDAIYTMSRAFEDCRLEKILDTFQVSKNCISMYRTFYNCLFDSEIPRNKYWTGSDSSNADNYGCVSENGVLPLIPDHFFDICLGATIDQCFARDSYSDQGLEGQLYTESTDDNPWWSSSKNVSSYSNLITNARIHPILGTPTGGTDDGSGTITGQVTIDYIFPTWYVNSVCQCRVFIPIFTDPANNPNPEKLVIFESVPTDGSGYGGALPSLPPSLNIDYRYGGLREYSVYLTETDSITLSPSETYRGLIPLSLANVLRLNDNILFNNATGKNIDFSLSSNHPVVSGVDTDDAVSYSFRYWNTDEIMPVNARPYITY
jgi:hypothetical protein